MPNTSYVLQETVQNYGPFKGQYSQNLDLVVKQRVLQDKMTSIPAWMVGLIVFGSIDPVTNYKFELLAYQAGFSREACRVAWSAVGAAPLTKACLNNSQVRKLIGDGGNDDK